MPMMDITRNANTATIRTRMDEVTSLKPGALLFDPTPRNKIPDINNTDYCSTHMMLFLFPVFPTLIQLSQIGY
jgi:hypothetical protein